MTDQTNRWRKSSHSATPQGECVECAPLSPHTVGIRDSKTASGPRLEVCGTAWTTFLTTTRNPSR
ncbi:DUF397 domain-containing protein [Embleya sp. NPDC020630]|uniref:DUF397 domain-containing protein n=1 Tax=Embleya sp. NPDC020630 TaxID=3363979 RepID=UPI0037BA74AE